MGPTILLDMRPAVVRPTGVGVVAREIALALAANAPESRFVLFANSRSDRFPTRDFPARNVEVVDRRYPHRLLSSLWSKARWPPVELLAGPCDIAHAFEPLPLPTRKARTVATVHDLFFLSHPEKTDPAQTAHLVANVSRLLPRADRVVAVSEHVRREAIERLGLSPDRIVAIHHGLRPEQRAPATAEETRELRKRLRLPNSFILFVGTIEPRKNVGGLIRAFARLRAEKRHDGAKLILCGQRGFDHVSQEKAIADCNITTEVRILDYLGAADVKALMALARLVAVPSLDEGFSLPLIEAMAQGTPVAASRRGAIPEVAGGAAALFDPDDQDEMVETMASALCDESRRAELSARGRERAASFTWDEAAKKLLAVYGSLCQP